MADAGVPDIDAVVLTRDQQPLPPEVERGLHAQVGVTLHVHRLIGARRPGDRNRWDAICRARNQSRHVGTAPWVLLLDDDVELPPDAVRQLWEGLAARPNYAALAADYLGEHGRLTPRAHVALGAALFRRADLAGIRFRWQPHRCECQCCCDDLRAGGRGIAYAPGVTARHQRAGAATAGEHPPAVAEPVAAAPPHILVAFDRRHADKFRRQFLYTLRAHGNQEPVVVVGYGLYPSEQARLARLPGVRVISLPVNGIMPPIRRLRDFQPLLAALPPQTPVAYWDAGDVIFQAGLAPLWRIVRENSGKLLAVREPKSHPQNAAVAAWTLSIRDPPARQRAFQLLSRNPFLNSGFAGGTAQTLLQYCREADRALHAPDLAGTSDWGDQTALNYYCHVAPERWVEIPQGWNYCLHDRALGEVHVGPDGRLVARTGCPIYAAHGNARSLRKLALHPGL